MSCKRSKEDFLCLHLAYTIEKRIDRIINHHIMHYVYAYLHREATKKKSKKTSQQVWTISKNGESTPHFRTILADFGTWKLMFFAIIKSLWIRGIDKVSLEDLFKVKL